MIASSLVRLLVVASALFATACSVEILHDIDEPQANTTLAVLQQAGVAAQKHRVASGSKASYTIEVPRGDAPRAWQLLRRHSLPRKQTPGLGEIFGSQSSLVPSQTEQQALLRHALAGELTKTLQSIGGVRDARVHVVLPRRNPLAPPEARQPKPRAAVLLKVAGKPQLTVTQVQRLVAGSVEGLEASAVEVVLVPALGGKATTSSTPPTALASVGPFRVAAASRGGLLSTLIVGVVLILALALATLVLTLRYRALARVQAEQGRAGRATSADLDASLSLLGRSFQGSRQRDLRD